MRLLLCTFIFLTSACLAEPVSTKSTRDYSGVFDGLQISDANKKTIINFDLMAFQADQELYLSAGLHEKKLPNGISTFVAQTVYAGSLSPIPRFLSGNIFILENSKFFPYLTRSNSREHANLMFVGVSNIYEDSELSFNTEVADFLGRLDFSDVKANSTYFASNSCAVYGVSEDGKIFKTLVFLELDPQFSHDPSIRKEATYCLNIGHYYHFGFSNVLNEDPSLFAEQSPTTGYFTISPKLRVVFPGFFKDGHMAGKSRLEVLRAYAEAAAENKKIRGN